MSELPTTRRSSRDSADFWFNVRIDLLSPSEKHPI